MLTAHRTAAMQAAMLGRSGVSLAVLVHQMALQVFGSGSASNRIVQVSIERTHLKPDAENIEQSPAGMAIEGKRRYWQKRMHAAGQEGKDLLVWLLDQSQQDILDLLSFCTAVSVNTVSGRVSAPSEDVAMLMSALNLDMADWWEATGENYFSHVSKDRVLTIVAEAVSPRHAQNLNGLNKGDLVRQAGQALSGVRWLPDNFRVTKTRDQ